MHVTERRDGETPRHVTGAKNWTGYVSATANARRMLRTSITTIEPEP
jgi:hypothetical protein